ncbi:hypothetical protein [Thalassospira xiamenensis]|jgi:hypothetical protein|uniref:Uncharacterized protein n=1 Tax=Thalassospira xiamenensis TaxID=220697 RepID=A0A367X1E0_9PROT|nr:hypothetical protein [Thalassospira xiamenensis]KZB56160.1 hypothetical protein AUP41_15590 [Thalassospira xiamenensis]MCK2166031.1 hypothetical protein [Thalassospira xiamenensis]RCK47496.1 hypothetical protein TH44_17675 [Thalassospira xiamenensis]UKV16008.1 hypothetical protein L6172_06770 [Thalassospiraceae bacterium SW-3-3]
MFGELPKERRRFWLFFIAAMLVIVGSERLWAFLPSEVPPGLAFDEFNKRCVVNVDDFSVLANDVEIAPYLIDGERMKAAFSEGKAYAWQYEHKSYDEVSVLLSVTENRTCTVLMSGQGFDTMKSALESGLDGRIKQIDLPPERPGTVSYVLFDESGFTRRAIIVLTPVAKKGFDFGVALVKPVNSHFRDGITLDDYPVFEE